MGTFNYKGKIYDVDSSGFLSDANSWDQNFAEGAAAKLGIDGRLTKEHWDVINSIRKSFAQTGRCPLVYEVCRLVGLHQRQLKALFPTGYLRGACKIAGVTYREGSLGQAFLPLTAEDLNVISANKVYEVDVRGFLVDPNDWDEYYAAHRAYDMKIPGGKLTDRHWRIIRYLRQRYESSEQVPTVYETCEANQISLEELEQLFPTGYHRGAVKISGLRVR